MQPLAAPAVDLAPYRCPDPDPRISTVWREPLQGDIKPKAKVCPADSLKGICDDQLLEWIDRLKQSEKRKNAAGVIQEADNKRCRDGVAVLKPPTS